MLMYISSSHPAWEGSGGGYEMQRGRVHPAAPRPLAAYTLGPARARAPSFIRAEIQTSENPCTGYGVQERSKHKREDGRGGSTGGRTGGEEAHEGGREGREHRRADARGGRTGGRPGGEGAQEGGRKGREHRRKD